MNAFFTPDFLKFFVPLVGAVCAWYLNQKRQRQHDEYQRKEERYRDLLIGLRGMTTDWWNEDLRQKFSDQVNLSWLYCPDEVILAAYEFLYLIKPGSTCTQTEVDLALGELISRIRKDLLSRRIVKRTSLGASDFHFVTVIPDARSRPANKPEPETDKS